MKRITALQWFNILAFLATVTASCVSAVLKTSASLTNHHSITLTAKTDKMPDQSQNGSQAAFNDPK